MSENIDIEQNLQNTLSNDYHFDMYEVNYHVVKDNFNIEKKILNTKQLYCKYHPTFDIESFNKFPTHFLKEIVKKDIVICFDDTLIFRELYKIIAWFDNTNTIQEFITSKKYKRHIKANSNITSQMTLKNTKLFFLLPILLILICNFYHISILQ